MAHIYADRVYETSTTTGTGTYTLAGAKNGTYRAFSAVCANNDTVYYAAFDSANGGWETGLGTWATGGTLARTTVHASSNAGAAVNWAAGTREIFLCETKTSREVLTSYAVVEGDTSPNPGVAGVWAWSSTLNCPVVWNGDSWQAPIVGGSGRGAMLDAFNLPVFL